VTRDDLLQLFGSAGTVSDVILPMDRATGRPRGFAFVEFTSDADADAAIQALNGKELGGRPINVSEARERVPRIRTDVGESGPFGFRNRPFKTKGSRRGIRGRKRSL
jgi:cold-inducible RNA-binding protein